MRIDDGVISPGAVGYDINCGSGCWPPGSPTRRFARDWQRFAERLFRNIPSGVGAHGRLRLTDAEIPDVLRHGAAWAVRRDTDVQATSGDRIRGTIPEAQP